MKNSELSKEIDHSIKTIKKAYERSPDTATNVITSTLPSTSRDDYNSMHQILERSKEEDCRDEICKTTIANVLKSMSILREEHERNPSQVEATKQLLEKKHGKIHSEECTIMSVHDVTYGEELSIIFKNMNRLSMEEQKKFDQEYSKITYPLLQDISFAPIMFETASVNDLSIMVIPKEFISLSLDQISDIFHKAYDYLFCDHSNDVISF